MAGVTGLRFGREVWRGWSWGDSVEGGDTVEKGGEVREVGGGGGV